MAAASLAQGTSRELTPADRRRGLLALQVTTFLTWAGFFLVIPLIAVHYVDDLGWAASSIGIVLAVRQFLQQGSTAFSGALADRLGAKGLICAGLLVRGIGFALMAWASTFPILLLSAVIAALGGGLFESPKAAAAATLTDVHNRRRYYSTMGVVGGIGTAAGTQVGAMLIGVNFDIVALGAGAVYLIAFVAMIVVLPSVQVATERHGLFDGIAFAIRDRVFVTYALLLMGYWFVATQFNLALVLRATDVAGTESAVAWIYWIQSGIVILLGYPLPRLVEKRIASYPMLIVGIVLVSVGMGLVGLPAGVPTLLVAVFVIALGTVLTRPGEQTVSANLADPAARGSYFGVASLSLAIGGGLGNFTGGLIYDFGQSSGRPALPWLVFLVAGSLSALGLWRTRGAVHRMIARRQAAELALLEELERSTPTAVAEPAPACAAHEHDRQSGSAGLPVTAQRPNR